MKMLLPNNSPKQHKSIPTWFAFSASSTFFIFLLLYFNSSIIISAFSSLSLFDPNLINARRFLDPFSHDQSLNQSDSLKNNQENNNITFPSNVTANSPLPSPNPNECDGKYIYIHNLPPRFNIDLLKNCHSLNPWTDMCKHLANSGLGPHLAFSKGSSLFEGTGWFSTHQFSLEVIIHNRMKRYKCLTNDSTQASAIFVPFYAGLDAGRFLWDNNITRRDALAIDLIKWLRGKPEWVSMWGKNHFLVAGRITWDFRRVTDKSSDWGNKLLFLPELKNMTNLVIESSDSHYNEAAIPYPTYFHPSTQNEVIHWQQRVNRQKRPYLFSFAGAPRPQMSESIRNHVISQCLNSSSSPTGKCKLLRCDQTSKNCDDPSSLMKLFMSSVFCLQPPGDSYTRRSAFDSILAGCIPVFFHPGSAYLQYLWHLPNNNTKYSVFINVEDVKSGNVSIQKKLSVIPRDEVEAMREEVIRLIPRIVYANPMAKESDRSFEDAFDIAVSEILNKIEALRKEIKEERDSNSSLVEEFTRNHEWDSFFSGTV